MVEHGVVEKPLVTRQTQERSQNLHDTLYRRITCTYRMPGTALPCTGTAGSGITRVRKTTHYRRRITRVIG